MLGDTGNTGIPDGYKDPDGDSFINLEECYNGTDPLVFNTPDAPGGLNVALNNSGGNETATITWNSPDGAVSGYVVLRDSGSGFVAVATNSAASTTYTDHSLPANGVANYEIQAVYPLGSSQITGSVSAFANQNYNFPIAIVNGPANRLYLVVSAMPAGVTNFLVTRTVYDPSSMLDAFYPIDFERWQQPPNYVSPATTNGVFSIPITSFSNGIALFPTNQVPLYCACDLSVQAVGEDGKCGPTVSCWGPSVSPMFHTYGTVPFVDGTAQMKNNLSFLMLFGNAPFDYSAFTTNGAAAGDTWHAGYLGPPMSYPSDYVYSSYYTEQGGIDQFMPFEDNCAFSNFQYNASFGTAAHPSPTPDIDDVNIFMDTSSRFF